MVAIPSNITKDFVQRLSPSDLRDIFENASEAIVDVIINLLPMPTQEDYEQAHLFLDDGIYDSEGNIIGEKHPDD